MAYLKAQSLNRRLVIEKNVGGQNNAGIALDDWRPVWRGFTEGLAQTGASMIGNEIFTADTHVSRVAASFRIRKPTRTTIDAGMRAICEGVTYNVHAVSPDLRDNRYLFIAVAQGANLG